MPNPMNRRSFLRFAAAAAVGVCLPGCLGEGFRKLGPYVLQDSPDRPGQTPLRFENPANPREVVAILPHGAYNASTFRLSGSRLRQQVIRIEKNQSSRKESYFCVTMDYDLAAGQPPMFREAHIDSPDINPAVQKIMYTFLGEQVTRVDFDRTNLTQRMAAYIQEQAAEIPTALQVMSSPGYEPTSDGKPVVTVRYSPAGEGFFKVSNRDPYGVPSITTVFMGYRGMGRSGSAIETIRTTFPGNTFPEITLSVPLEFAPNSSLTDRYNGRVFQDTAKSTTLNEVAHQATSHGVWGNIFSDVDKVARQNSLANPQLMAIANTLRDAVAEYALDSAAYATGAAREAAKEGEQTVPGIKVLGLVTKGDYKAMPLPEIAKALDMYFGVDVRNYMGGQRPYAPAKRPTTGPGMVVR